MPPTTLRRRPCWRRGAFGASCASPRDSSRGCRPSPATSAADGHAGAGASCPRHRSARRHSPSRGTRSTSRQSSSGPRWPSWWTGRWVPSRRSPARPCASATWTTGALRRSPIAPAARPTRSRCASPEARRTCAARWRATCVRRRSRSGSRCPRPTRWAHTRVHCTQCGVGTLLMRIERRSGHDRLPVPALRPEPVRPGRRVPARQSGLRPPAGGAGAPDRHPAASRRVVTRLLRPAGWRPATSRARNAAPGCPFRPTSATTCPPAATAAGSTPTAPTAGSRSRPR